MSDINNKIEKLRFHINLISESIDSESHPIPVLVIGMNWSNDDLNAAHDIFEKYDKLIEEKQDINWSAFEHELRDRFGIGYQSVKSIILAFYRNHQWTDVCQRYAKAYECLEFHEITRPRP